MLFRFFIKLKKFFRNPRKYIRKSLFFDRIYHIGTEYGYPSIYPKTIFGKILGKEKRYYFYNNLFKVYPIYSELINLKHNDSVSNNENSIIKSEFSNLIETGIDIKHQFLPQNIFEELKKSLEKIDLKDYYGNFTYDYETLFYSFNTSLIPKLVFCEIKNKINKYSEILFGKYHSPKISLELIKGGKHDLNDPNTILHIDRFVPTLKAFYFPYAVDHSNSPFIFSPFSHKINQFHKVNYLKYEKTYINNVPQPYGMTHLYRDCYQEEKIIVPENTLVFALTNGLHRRSGFLKNSVSSRWSFRFDWYTSLSKMDCLTIMVKNKFSNYKKKIIF